MNAHPGGGPGTPFGGVKQSGIGVEGGGQLGLKEFVDVTTLRVAKTGTHTRPEPEAHARHPEPETSERGPWAHDGWCVGRSLGRQVDPTIDCGVW